MKKKNGAKGKKKKKNTTAGARATGIIPTTALGAPRRPIQPNLPIFHGRPTLAPPSSVLADLSKATTVSRLRSETMKVSFASYTAETCDQSSTLMLPFAESHDSGPMYCARREESWAAGGAAECECALHPDRPTGDETREAPRGSGRVGGALEARAVHPDNPDRDETRRRGRQRARADGVSERHADGLEPRRGRGAKPRANETMRRGRRETTQDDEQKEGKGAGRGGGGGGGEPPPPSGSTPPSSERPEPPPSRRGRERGQRARDDESRLFHTKE